jgi:2-phospho-L-lactate guanylyltransferase
VVVPFKSGGRKSRLSGVLKEGEREALSLVLLEGVMRAIGEAGLLDSCYLVTSDVKAAGLARRLGATAVNEGSDTGVNRAVELGISAAPEPEVLVVPADLPLFTRRDINASRFFRSCGADAVVSPSRSFDGTNLLRFAKAKPVGLSYDNDSFWNHVGDASRRGLRLAVYTGRGTMLDVDTEEDLRVLARERVESRAVAFARRLVGRWG